MALISPTFLSDPNASSIAAAFAPGVNILGDALTSAVQAGRQMVDLQQNQERAFLAERDKLRLLDERKGKEIARRFEADRMFDENVMQDRRNFSESVFQDRRDFDLLSEMQRGNMALANSRLGLESERLRLQRERFDRESGLLDGMDGDKPREDDPFGMIVTNANQLGNPEELNRQSAIFLREQQGMSEDQINSYLGANDQSGATSDYSQASLNQYLQGVPPDVIRSRFGEFSPQVQEFIIRNQLIVNPTRKTASRSGGGVDYGSYDPTNSGSSSFKPRQ